MDVSIVDIVAGILKPTAVAAGGAGVGWWFSRRRQTAEAKGKEIDNAQEIVAMWRDLINELKKLTDEQAGKIKELESRLDKQAATLIEQENEIKKLRAENIRLKTAINKLKD